ncbi:MAG: glutamate--tRNA ligase [Abditibacteriota bacterium]|nr:glutamate--tRNA ligase [Abditibacteriota bacterium]
MTVRLRFAPSPTGSPHIGNIRTAVFDYLYARHCGGDFILRVEDTDRTRYQEGSLEDMMTGLRWMGMQWDEGPDAGGDKGPYFQSQRLELYHKYAKRLLDSGRAYYCYCTKERLEEMRKEQEANHMPPGYDRKCRNLTEEEREAAAKENPNPVIRFAMKREGRTEFDDIVRGHVGFDNELQDDFIIIKADGFPTYHFASIVDDHLMGITHVVRGEEWLSSAPKHLQLYEAMGWEPPVWVHLPLILGTDGKKLSKRSGTSTTFIDYMKSGYLPDAMLNFLATMGWSSGEDRKLFSREELIKDFTLEGITNHPAIFDLAKLNDLQGEYVRMLSVEELADMLEPIMAAAGCVKPINGDDPREYLLKVTELIQDRIVLLNEAPETANYFYTDDFDYDPKGVRKHFSADHAVALAERLAENLEAVNIWTHDDIEAAVRKSAHDLDLPKDALAIHAARLATTGKTGGPGLFELMLVLGKDVCVKRVRRAGNYCAELAKGE